MFCCTLLYVCSSIAIILMGKRELIALLNLSSWCLVMVERLFLAVPRGCLQFVIVVFPDHTHLLFFITDTHKFLLIIYYNTRHNLHYKLHPYTSKPLLLRIPTTSSTIIYNHTHYNLNYKIHPYTSQLLL